LNLPAGLREYVSSLFDLFLHIQSSPEQILDQLKPWTRTLDALESFGTADVASKPCNKGKKAIKHGPQPEPEPEMEPKVLIMPESPTPAAIAASIDIHTMWRAFGHYKHEKLLTVLTHAELTGLAVRWFAKASTVFFYVPHTNPRSSHRTVPIFLKAPSSWVKNYRSVHPSTFLTFLCAHPNLGAPKTPGYKSPRIFSTSFEQTALTISSSG